MPPKLKVLPRKPPAYVSKAVVNELTIGNVRVGPNGVEFTGTGDLQVMLPELKIETLTRVRSIGEGVQGNVSMYVTPDQKQYAVKKIPISSMCEDRMRQTVAAELRNIFSQKANPYTVCLYNAYYRDGFLRLVMEYMDWGSLQELIDVHPQIEEPIAAFVATELLNALNILHTKSNIVTESNSNKTLRQIHRDIKPANILLSTDGRVKVTDFGIAASTETLGVSSFVGTATYMSPERIQGQRYSTPSDIWSVGVVVAQLLLGRYPFTSIDKDFMALLKEVTMTDTIEIRESAGCSQEAEDFVNSCLRQNPEDRSSALELLSHPWIIQHVEEGRQMLGELLPNVKNTAWSDDVKEGQEPAF